MSTIEEQFKACEASRSIKMRRARRASAVSDPTILPPDGHTADHNLPEPAQSVVNRGLMNVAGMLLTALFPAGSPWFQFTLPPEIEFDDSIPVQVKLAANKRLFHWELMATAAVESQRSMAGRHVRRTTFRSNKHRSLKQLCCIGDTLEHMSDEFSHRTFRLSDYVTQRDLAGAVLYHITREKRDVLTFSEEKRARMPGRTQQLASLKRPVHERIVTLWTMVEWNPIDEHWVLTEEVDGQTIATWTEKISPYFSTAMALGAGDNYGTGIIEAMIGECTSLDELEWRRLQILGLVAQKYIGIDKESLLRDRDLQKPPGSVLEGVTVRDGKVQDIGIVEFSNPGEMAMLSAGIQDKTQKISETMLVTSAIGSPGGRERVTAYERQQVASEVNGMLGGYYVPIADSQQVPMLDRTVYLLKQKRLIQPMPEGTVEFRTLTGLNALVNEGKAQSLLELAQVVSTLPEGQNIIDYAVLVETYQDLRSIYAPGVIKSPEQRAAEAQAAIEQELQLAGGQQAIASAGAFAEQAALRALPAGA